MSRVFVITYNSLGLYFLYYLIRIHLFRGILTELGEVIFPVVLLITSLFIILKYTFQISLIIRKKSATPNKVRFELLLWSIIYFLIGVLISEVFFYRSKLDVY
tara:strand:+ start:1051 stop:1359 length:309 start_codon:yes stop_codon:yes gene_type:complete